MNYGTFRGMTYPTIESAIGKTPLVALQRIGAAGNAQRGNVILASSRAITRRARSRTALPCP